MLSLVHKEGARGHVLMAQSAGQGACPPAAALDRGPGGTLGSMSEGCGLLVLCNEQVATPLLTTGQRDDAPGAPTFPCPARTLVSV